MSGERTVEFAYTGLMSLVSEVEWPKDLPLPKEPNLPKGSTIIEMPNSHHKGVARDSIGELYHCIEGLDGYQWRLADNF